MMNKLTLSLALGLLLSSCSYLRVHHMDIEQGNVITPEMVRLVHVGMTRDDVKNILGEPVLANVFDPNRLDYVYTFKPGHGKTIEKYVTYIIHNGRVAEIQGNV